MERVIKFRAWDKKENKFTYPKLWDNTMPSNWEYWYDLQQFTGLHDRDGKEIYEGDLLEFNQNYEGWNDDYYKRYKVEIPKIYYTVEFNGLSGDSIQDIKIIGNIYENKDLL
jgi:uncharacterized phage protein (TIGR01671 family)